MFSRAEKSRMINGCEEVWRMNGLRWQLASGQCSDKLVGVSGEFSENWFGVRLILSVANGQWPMC